MFGRFLLSLLVVYVCSEDCPDQWSQYKDHCYWPSTSSAYSWKAAERVCESLGGYLTEIEDHDENDFIARMTFGAGTWFFMGIVREEQSSGYVTASNSDEVEYSNWLEIENNEPGGPRCTRMGYLGYWDSYSCDEKQYFICESDEYIGSSSFGTWLSKTNLFRYEDHYYRTVGKKATYAEAQKMCKRAGAYLVEPNDEGENVYVHDKMHEVFHGHWRYIGGSDTKQEGYFVWSDNRALTFENWWPGEPNNKYNEDCMEMRYWGKWNDVDCYHNNRYICEKAIEEKDPTHAEVGTNAHVTTEAEVGTNVQVTTESLVEKNTQVTTEAKIETNTKVTTESKDDTTVPFTYAWKETTTSYFYN
ncbi:C-type mannose receptor 2-like [Mytilus trossulus]|uniref:C-type mannose receptor 2-like n=1 Tax=Mytilus trossulus TaxID=6551 RepID=UPI0030047E30